MIKCKHCNSMNVKFETKGSHTGAYCNECGGWIKWATQSELIIHKTSVATFPNSNVVPDNLTHFSSKELLHELLKRIND